MRNDPFHQAVPDHAAYERKAQEVRKTNLEGATAEFFGELIEQLQENNPEQLQALLDFYAGKVTRWSSRNLLAIRVQKPQIQRAVTPTEIKAHGHTLKRGAKAASIWVPVFEGSQELREHQRTLARQVQWSQQAGIDLHDVPAVRSEYADWKERQVAAIREDRALAEAGGTAAAIDEDDERLIAQATSVEAYLQSERPDWVLDETKADAIGHILQSALEQAGAFNPAPPQGGDRVGWALSACVYDLGKDTEGPALDLPGAAIDPQEGRQFLEAAGLYAKSKGVEVTTEAGGMGGGEAGAVGLYRKKGGRQEEKIYLARWSGLATRCATVLHEIAHYLAGHHRVERAKDQTARREQSRPEEHLAEATAYVVGRQFGIPVDYSAAYLKSWGATPFELQRQLSAVRDLSKEMILGIEDELQTLQRKQKAGEAARLDPRQEPNPRTATEPVYQETFVRCRGKIYDEGQVAELLLALGALEHPHRQRVTLLHNQAEAGEPPCFQVVEGLSAKEYQTRLLVEFAEQAAESEGARYVWVEPDGNFNYGFEPGDVPEGVEAVEVAAPDEPHEGTSLKR